MKKNKTTINFLLAILFLATTNSMYSQEKDTDKLNNNKLVYLYFLGVGVGYEQVLANQFSVQASANYNAGFAIGNDAFESIYTLGFAIEPRYYYNFNKRNRNGKNTKNNASNFFSTEISLFPDLLSYSSKEGAIKLTKYLSISPMWNIKRNIGQSNFSYELNIGFRHYKNYYSDMTVNKNSIALNGKIGYNF